MAKLQGKFLIVDARSGKVVMLRQPVCYRDGECWKMLRVDHFGRKILLNHNRLGTIWVSLTIRADHPNYPGQTVAFVPS